MVPFLHVSHLLYVQDDTSVRSRVNLVKIKSSVTFEQVSELSLNFFRNFRIKERMICTILIHFVPFIISPIHP